jgi:hypothetical protein
MKRMRIAVVRFVAYRLLSDRAGYNFLRFARRRGWATWAELDQLPLNHMIQETRPNEQ